MKFLKLKISHKHGKNAPQSEKKILVPISLVQGHLNRLNTVELNEELICDNNHERNTIPATLICVQECTQRACGLNPMCAHSVNLSSFNECEDLDHKADSSKIIENALSYADNKGFIHSSYKYKFERACNFRRFCDTLLQRHLRQEPTLAVNNLPEEIDQIYRKLKESYNPDKPDEKKEFMKLKRWIYEEIKNVLDLLKETLK